MQLAPLQIHYKASLSQNTQRQTSYSIRPKQRTFVKIHAEAEGSSTSTDKKAIVPDVPISDGDDDFENRLEKLIAREGGSALQKRSLAKQKARFAKMDAESMPAKPKYDFSKETLYWEGRPAVGDLVTNIVFLVFIVWLPLTLSAIARYAWTRYRVTDLRLSIIKDSPIKKEQSEVAYQEVSKVVAIGRGVGLWGDMVLTLKNGDKIEMRSVPDWDNIKKFIEDRVQALSPDAIIEDEDDNKKKNLKGFG